MFIQILAFISQYIGLIISKFTAEELEQGQKYFKILCLVILVVLILVNLNNFNVILFIIGFLIAFIFKEVYFYFGVLLFSNINLLNSSLVFLYGLPYSSIRFFRREWRLTYLNIIFFFSAIAFTYFSFNFMSLAVGAFVSFVIQSFLNFVKFDF